MASPRISLVDQNLVMLGSAASVALDLSASSALLRLKLDASTETTAASNVVGQDDVVLRITLDGLTNHVDEGLADRSALLGRRLEMVDVVVFGAPRLSFCSVHPPCRQINFVSDQNERECFHIIWTSILDKSISPLVKSLEALRIGQVVTKSTAVSTAVKGEAQ